MITFFICLIILISSYFLYGKNVDNIFKPNDEKTPAVKINDGIDYVALPRWKNFLIQLLNIAGLGPIFGAISGAIWGPVVFLWITFGTIFIGGVHDYFSGMLSERNEGKSISEICGIYLGPIMQNIMRVFCVILLIMVGTVFAVGPAELIAVLIKDIGGSGILTNSAFWLVIIFIYYFIATFISVDKIIGKIYPLFGICLIIMAISVVTGVIVKPEFQMIELWDNFKNMHPDKVPIWSFMFITVACGAVSGFHSTQSPIVSRCIQSEKQGKFVFYGAMVAESIIALIWASAGLAVYGTQNGVMLKLNEVGGGNAVSVYNICKNTMGGIGIALAMIGVIICPITSGDTAFRSARLTIADWFHINQKSFKNRLVLCIPIFTVGAILGFGNTLKYEMVVDGVAKMVSYIDYSIIWRYFSWTNQTLAMIVLWATSIYLAKNEKNYWVTVIPAIFMSAVSITYFVCAPECLGLIPFLKNNYVIAYPVGIICAIVFLIIFLYKTSNKWHTKL